MLIRSVMTPNYPHKQWYYINRYIVLPLIMEKRKKMLALSILPFLNSRAKFTAIFEAIYFNFWRLDFLTQLQLPGKNVFI